MKIKYLIALMVLMAWNPLPAATTTITTTTTEDAIIVQAFGDILGLGRNATQAEVKAAMVAWLRGQVMDWERRQNMTTYSPPPISPQ